MVAHGVSDVVTLTIKRQNVRDKGENTQVLLSIEQPERRIYGNLSEKASHGIIA